MSTRTLIRPLARRLKTGRPVGPPRPDLYESDDRLAADAQRTGPADSGTDVPSQNFPLPRVRDVRRRCGLAGGRAANFELFEAFARMAELPARPDG
jgi:hypothetical protein